MKTKPYPIPPRLRSLAESLPTPAALRQAIDETRRELVFLKKLLPVAVAAQANTTESGGQSHD